MKTIRKSDGRIVFSKEGVGDVRSVDVGDITIEFGSVEQPIDPTPLFRGLPDDMCQCDHFGYVVKGTYRFRSKDSEVTFSAGDVFHVSPGHIPLPGAGSEWVMFTRSADQRRTDAAVAANSAALL